MRAVALALILALIPACASLRLGRPPRTVEPGHLAAITPPSPECIALSSKTLAWNLVGIVTGAIGSGSATGAGIFSSNEIARDVMAGGAAVFSLAAAVSNYLGGFYGARYTRSCQ